MDEFSRTELLLGGEGMNRLRESTIAIFGIGGVGSYAAEALARCGIGGFGLYDNDSISITNINRQLIATHTTLGKDKVYAAQDRILSINPAAKVEAFHLFYGPGNADDINLSRYTYIVDAIDTVTSKLLLIENAAKCGVPIISSMGAGNKLDPTMFETADIYETSVCPLAKIMRKELKARGIDSLRVVYSKEPSAKKYANEGGRKIPGSIAFVPSVVGLILAGEVVKGIVC